jgi:hypothetical protein
MPEQKTIEGYIRKSAKHTSIKIRGVHKVSNYVVKIKCQHEKDARTLQTVKWDELQGAHQIKPTYGVVVHRVAKIDINPGAETCEEAKKSLESSNDVRILKIVPLMLQEEFWSTFTKSSPTHHS